MAIPMHGQGRNGDVPVILVVDDEEPVVGLLTDVLEDQGYTVIAAHNGRVALQLAQERHPDLVISDVMMPFVDGIELTRRLRAGNGTRDIPVILMSAAMSPDLVACGANDFVGKPFAIDRIDNLVARYVGAGRP